MVVEGIKVESSNINKIGYGTHEDLYVEYKSGNTYKYKGVPHDLFEEFTKAESKGRFMNEKVKGKFDYEKVEL